MRFFDGLFIGELGFQASKNVDGTLDTRTTDVIDKSMLHFWHAKSFMGNIKVFWLSQFVRYIVRPQTWFKDVLKRIVNAKLRSLRCGNQEGAEDIAEMVTCMATQEVHNCCMVTSVQSIPRPYANLHVRYGDKAIEQNSQPVHKYMNYVRKKAPYIRNIFISTETQSVIHELSYQYPYYTFYYIDYKRNKNIFAEPKADIDFGVEFTYSFANLYMSVEADFFVGTLSSSWCALIHHMERTRGDGGVDYLSADLGSQYTVCF